MPTLISVILLGVPVLLHWCMLHAVADDDTSSIQGSSDGELASQEIGELELAKLTSYLDALLSEPPWSDQDSPLVYIEDPPVEPDELQGQGLAGMALKRSRYYRRYPWKRQNTRNRSDESRYMCNPTKEDVFQLLVALHDAQEGNTRRTVSFCNRKRPASAIFTNIRFLGRRRK